MDHGYDTSKNHHFIITVSSQHGRLPSARAASSSASSLIAHVGNDGMNLFLDYEALSRGRQIKGEGKDQFDQTRQGS